MTDFQIEQISEQDEATKQALLELNNEHAQETSLLTGTKWNNLLGQAFSATCVEQSGAFLLTLDQDADYDSINFKWFLERYPRFVYVDRIIVASTFRGKGIAGLLYRDLFRRSLKAGHNLVACEVNLIPPNPKSIAFHRSMGFEDLERVEQESSGRTVQYMVRRL